MINHLAFSWLLLPSLLALAASDLSTSAQPHRDPFRTPQQEQSIEPALFANRTTPLAAQRLRQWRLQGVLGNPYRGLWGLVRTPTGNWHCLRVGELIMGYQVIEISPQRLLRVQPALPLPKRSAQRHPWFPVLRSPTLTTVIFRLPPPRRLEQPLQQPSPHHCRLPCCHPTARSVHWVKSLKDPKPTVIAEHASSDEPLTTAREKNVNLISKGHLQKLRLPERYTKLFREKAYFVGKLYDKAITSNQPSLAELQPSDSSEPDGNQITPVPPAVEPTRQYQSVGRASADNKPLHSTYPPRIAEQLPNPALLFDEGLAKAHFRKFFGLCKTTTGPEWNFSKAERVFAFLAEQAPRFKEVCLNQSGKVPKRFFWEMSDKIAQYSQPGFTQENYMIRDIWYQFSKDMADFNQLVQSLAASGLTKPIALHHPSIFSGEAPMCPSPPLFPLKVEILHSKAVNRF